MPRRKIALSNLEAHRHGTRLAVAGWTREQVERHLDADGRTAGTKSRARVLRAYDEQIARG